MSHQNFITIVHLLLVRVVKKRARYKAITESIQLIQFTLQLKKSDLPIYLEVANHFYKMTRHGLADEQK